MLPAAEPAERCWRLWFMDRLELKIEGFQH